MSAPTAPSKTTSRRFFGSLSAKFLIVFIPVFLVVAFIGLTLLSRYDKLQDRDALVILFVSATFFIALMAAVTSFRLIIERPLERLLSSIREISENGKRTPVEAHTGDEIGDIIRAFNEMIERESSRERCLGDANVEIRNLNHSLEQRVRQRTEELRESERRLQRLVESFTSGIFIHAQFRPIYANRTLLDMFGFETLEDFLAMGSTAALLAPEDRERVWGYHQARLRGDPAPADYDCWALKTDGEKFRVNNRSFVVDWDGEPAICTTLFDLTERLAAQRSLVEQQHLINSLLETTNEGFWFIDLEGCTTDVNPAMCDILGRPREEIVGRKIFDFVDEGNRKIFHEQIERRAKGYIDAYEIALQRPDGTNVPCLNNATPLFNPEGRHFGSVGIWADITDLKQTQRALEQEKEKANAANNAKSEFLAIASHEIRTPMNGVLGMARLLLQSELTEEQKHRVRVIIQSGENLLGLINDILDISKIEAGRLQIERSPFDFRGMMDGVTALMESRASQKGLSYIYHIEEDIPSVVVGDVSRVRQILINLVGNAIKFTGTGRIEISVSQTPVDRDSLCLRFEVADTGIGIDASVQDRIFEKFSQADRSTTRQYGGTGLGLAICKDFAELMGGEIGLQSVVGEGSTFWFTVICSRGNAEEISAASPGGARFEEPDGGDLGSLQVLVAEDNQVNREIVRDTLEAAGHHVDLVNNGLEAVEAVRRKPYDVVLMDVYMPDMDGPSATEKIRELPGAESAVPIVALTADAMACDREKFMTAGMDGYVSKPFDPGLLFAVIARCVQKGGSGAGQEPSSGMIDQTILEPLRANNPALWRQVVEAYLQEMTKGLERLQSALDREDFAAVHLVAHSLKSSSANMGAPRLSDLLRRLESDAGSPTPDGCAALLDEVHAEFVAAAAEFGQEPDREAAAAG